MWTRTAGGSWEPGVAARMGSFAGQDVSGEAAATGTAGTV